MSDGAGANGAEGEQDESLPLWDLQLCISAAMAGRAELVRELRELGATVQCGVVSRRTTHCLATPQELSQPTRECALAAARTIPIVAASFVAACISSRRIVGWQDHQLAAQLPSPSGRPPNEAAKTELRTRSKPAQAAEDFAPRTANDGPNEESDVESEDMFADSHCFPTPGGLHPDDETRSSESVETAEASRSPRESPLRGESETIPFDDDDDDSIGRQDEDTTPDSSGAAHDEPAPAGEDATDTTPTQPAAIVEAQEHAGHDEPAPAGEDATDITGTPPTQPAAMVEAQEHAGHDEPAPAGEDATDITDTSPTQPAAMVEAQEHAGESVGDEAPTMPVGVAAANVDMCVSMGLDRHKSIGWLYACRLEADPLATALEWLLDKDDYDPPPILSRQQSVLKVHELMGGELSTDACEAELGADNDIDSCIDRLMKKLAKQTNKRTQSKPGQQPNRIARRSSRQATGCCGDSSASSQAESINVGDVAAETPDTAAHVRPKREAAELDGAVVETLAHKRAKTPTEKSQIELHVPTDEDEVRQRCSGSFEWINRSDQIQPSAEAARQYPWIQRAWEQLTDVDVQNMATKRWLKTATGPKLCDQPVYIAWLLSADHPARKHGMSRGRPELEIGVFASEAIEKGDEVLSYIGRPVSSKEPSTVAGGRSGEYAQLWQPGNACFDIEIDAELCRNAGPMVNDFRDNVKLPRSPNISSRNANLAPRHKYWKVPASGKGSVGSGFPLIVFVAKRDICPGEELLWDYGVGYWETRNQIEEDDVVMSSQQADDDDNSSQSQVY